MTESQLYKDILVHASASHVVYLSTLENHKTKLYSKVSCLQQNKLLGVSATCCTDRAIFQSLTAKTSSPTQLCIPKGTALHPHQAYSLSNGLQSLIYPSRHSFTSIKMADQPREPRPGDLSWRLSSHPITLLFFLGFRVCTSSPSPSLPSPPL